jgi:hypothetical protein
MLSDNNKGIVVYLDKLIASIFKILPLYEEENIGLVVNIESLIFSLQGLEKVINLQQYYEYISLLSILESLKVEIQNQSCTHKIVKREVFKSTRLVDVIIEKIKSIDDLEEGE